MINIRKQAASIGTAAALILGGSATAWALTNASPRTPITNQQGAEASASTTVQTDEPNPSATPSPTITPTAEPAASSTASAPALPTPTASATKASTPVTTPSTTPPPATTPTPRPNSTDPAAAGQYNGGHGTADNGPYPSRGPGDPNAPTGLPNKEANTPPSPKAEPTPSPTPSA